MGGISSVKVQLLASNGSLLKLAKFTGVKSLNSVDAYVIISNMMADEVQL
jgi:hypothetical protein